MANKKTYTKLPASLQTTAIKNFFESTVEQLFSTANVDQIQGFIGSQDAEDKDLDGTFIQEPTYTKRAYALTPAINTVNAITGKSENLIFYDELIDTLKTYGLNVANHNKVFSEKFASFLPPINIDKFVNYQEYYWHPQFPSTIEITPTVDNYIDVDRDIIGKKSFTPAGGKTFRNGMIIKLSGDYVIPMDCRDVVYIVAGVGEHIRLIKKDNNYNTRYSTVDYNSNSIDFVYKNRGLVEVSPTYTAPQSPPGFDDVALPQVYIRGETVPGETNEIQNVIVGTLAQYSGITTVSDGINSITVDHSVEPPRTVVDLVKQLNDATGYSDLAFEIKVATRVPTDYIIQQRGAENNNHWSRMNFWFHRQNFIDAGDSMPNRVFRAKRPIIEFDNTLELYNHGKTSLGTMDVDAFNLKFSQVDGMFVTEYIDGVTQVSYDKLLFSNESTDVSKYIYGAIQVSSTERCRVILTDDDIETELDTTIVLSGQGRQSVVTDITLNTEVDIVDPSNASVKLVGLHSIDASISPSINGTTLSSISVQNGGKGWYLHNQRKLIQLAHPTSPSNAQPGDDSFIPLEAKVNDVVHVKTGEVKVGTAAVWNGSTWEKAQEKSLPNQAPLFKLYDTTGTYVGDQMAYPNNTFEGNKIFGYASEVPESSQNIVRSTTDDQELGTKLIYKLFNAQSEIVFENFIETAQYNFTPMGSVATTGLTDGATNINGPYAINGFYPLYSDKTNAENRGNGTVHEHVFFGKVFYMPNGLEMGVTQFHGNYSGQLTAESQTINTTSTTSATGSTVSVVNRSANGVNNTPSNPSGGSGY